jgi:menaquinone-dependent protoporphyrinogen IX oxidase
MSGACPCFCLPFAFYSLKTGADKARRKIPDFPLTARAIDLSPWRPDIITMLAPRNTAASSRTPERGPKPAKK